jgi:hypothetical protein
VSEPLLDDVLHIELLALMTEGVLGQPCPYLHHAPWVEYDDAGDPCCPLCAPKRCHLCRDMRDLEPGSNGDGRWWCRDVQACDARARVRVRRSR